MRRPSVVLLALTICAGSALPAVAQQSPAGPQTPASVSAIPEATFTSAWQRVMAEHKAELDDAATPERRKAVFARILERFVNQPEFAALRNTDAYRAGVRRLLEELPDSATAQSSNAPLTNPATNQLMERSGATSLIALAGDFRRLFAADESAISVNVNALALVGGGKANARSAQLYYSNREAWKRLSGTLTFGAKVPEKQITGLSGLPSANDLFDAMSWDVKVRVVGDRDPLATRWYPLLLGRMSDVVELLTRVQGLVDVRDTVAVRDAATELLGASLADAKNRIASSLQISVKGSGVHLTAVEGRNKYSMAAMLDKGFDGVDLTANVSYNVAQISPAGSNPFDSKDVQLAAGVTGSALKGRIVEGRALELSASVQGKVFVDRAGVPVDRKNTFHVNGTLSLPFQLNGKIPISLTWTNDPNNLKKAKHVTGQIGLTYDFAAVWEAFKTQGQ